MFILEYLFSMKSELSFLFHPNRKEMRIKMKAKLKFFNSNVNFLFSSQNFIFPLNKE